MYIYIYSNIYGNTYSNIYSNLREFVVTTVILLPGVGNPGSVPGRLAPFPPNPINPLNPVNPVNPLDSSRGLPKRYTNHQNRTSGRENGSLI